MIAVPWGCCWGSIPSVIGREHLDDDVTGDAGIVLLDVSSESSVSIELGLQEWGEPQIAPWTLCKLLPVRHLQRGEICWSLFDTHGRAQYAVTHSEFMHHSVHRVPSAGGRRDVGQEQSLDPFAPGGLCKMLLGFRAYADAGIFYIWHWQRSELCVAHLPHGRMLSQHWGPCGNQTLCVFTDGRCFFHSCGGALLRTQHLLGNVQASAWADSGPVAVVYTSCLHIFTVLEGPHLTRVHVVDTALFSCQLTLYCWQPVFSPDGSFIACMGRAGARSGATVVALISVEGQVLGIHECDRPLAYSVMEGDWCTWAVDGLRVGVMYYGATPEHGLLHLLTLE